MTEWTEKRVAHLRKRWSAGATASTIARELNEKFGGHVSRNACIGKAARLGLLGRPNPIKSRDPAATNAKRRQSCEATLRSGKQPNGRADGAHAVVEARQRSQAALKVRTPVLVKPEPKPLLPARLSREACAWPIGDPKHSDFKFCSAKPVVPGKPYCSAHCEVAYRKPEDVAKERAEREAA